MSNNNAEQKSGSQSSKDIGLAGESEIQGQGPSSGKVGQGKQPAQSGSKSPQDNTDDDDLKTAGGREGNFSESKRGNEDQWSPGSTQSSDHIDPD